MHPNPFSLPTLSEIGIEHLLMKQPPNNHGSLLREHKVQSSVTQLSMTRSKSTNPDSVCNYGYLEAISGQSPQHSQLTEIVTTPASSSFIQDERLKTTTSSVSAVNPSSLHGSIPLFDQSNTPGPQEEINWTRDEIDRLQKIVAEAPKKAGRLQWRSVWKALEKDLLPKRSRGACQLQYYKQYYKSLRSQEDERHMQPRQLQISGVSSMRTAPDQTFQEDKSHIQPHQLQISGVSSIRTAPGQTQKDERHIHPPQTQISGSRQNLKWQVLYQKPKANKSRHCTVSKRAPPQYKVTKRPT